MVAFATFFASIAVSCVTIISFMCDTTNCFIDFKRLPYITHKCLIERTYIAADNQASRALFILLFIITQWWWNREVSKFALNNFIALGKSISLRFWCFTLFFPILLFDCNRTLYSLTLNQPCILSSALTWVIESREKFLHSMLNAWIEKYKFL